MIGHRSNQRGSTIIKRKFRGVPVIRRAIGTLDPTIAEQVDLMYKALYGQGRVDILEAVALKRVHPLAVLAQWRQGRELVLPAAETLPRLGQAWDQWAARIPGADHRSSIGTTRRALRIPESATIDALPDLFISFRERNRAKVRTVNIARAHVRAFLRDTVGTSHPLYVRVKDTQPLRRKPREKGTPHPLPFILEVVEKMNALLPQAGDMTWTLAATGMGNKEYWSDGFDAVRERVLIHGQKREGRDREVPLWDHRPLVKPVCWEGRFRRLLRQASDGQVAVYDLRRSFARWCEEAGVIRTNIDAYLGHGPKTMTDLYTWGQLPGQLTTDAAKLQAYRSQELASALVASA